MHIVIALLLSTAFSLGCNGNQSTTKIHAVKLLISASVNWDEDAEADGVQFLLIPTDADGWPVRSELTVSASLWSQPDVFKKERKR
jgi:hypothetical protein